MEKKDSWIFNDEFDRYVIIFWIDNSSSSYTDTERD